MNSTHQDSLRAGFVGHIELSVLPFLGRSVWALTFEFRKLGQGLLGAGLVGHVEKLRVGLSAQAGALALLLLPKGLLEGLRLEQVGPLGLPSRLQPSSSSCPGQHNDAGCTEFGGWRSDQTRACGARPAGCHMCSGSKQRV